MENLIILPSFPSKLGPELKRESVQVELVHCIEEKLPQCNLLLLVLEQVYIVLPGPSKQTILKKTFVSLSFIATSNVISEGPPCKDDNARFTNVPLKPISHQ